MPYSHPAHYSDVALLVRENFDPSTTSIIDIGAGSGTYRDIFPEYTLDGIEVYEKYINDFRLRARYREIFNTNVLEFTQWKKYDLAIMGDILEHLSVEDAKSVLSALKKAKVSVLVQIPYLYEQGEYDGNHHEIHLQPDLTREVFMERYAEFGFKFLKDDHVCGAYYAFYPKKQAK